MFLRDFAKHTGHIPGEIADVSDIARKWIAAHVAADTSTTYHLIADDYDAIALRTQDPPLSEYRRMKMDPHTFVWVMRDGYARNTPVDTHDPATPRLGAFCDALFPVDAREEQWQRLRRDDLWKPRAYFVASQCADSPELIRAVADDDAKFPDLWSRIRLYRQEVAKPVGAAEWAAILGPLTELEAYPIETTTTPAERLDIGGEDEERVVPDVVPPGSNAQLWKDIRWCTEDDPTPMDWKAIRAHPVMNEYREQTLIAPTAPTHKVFKQVLLRGMGRLVVPVGLRIPNQDFITTPPTQEERSRIASLIRDHLRGGSGVISVSALDPSEEAHRSSYQVMAATAEVAVSPVQFLRDSILYYITSPPPDGGDAATTHAFKAHIQRFPDPHPALERAILDIKTE